MSPAQSPIDPQAIDPQAIDPQVIDRQADAAAEFEARVAKIIEIIRPAIQADEGDIFLRKVHADTGIVDVELVGACITCPVSTGTLKDGLERILVERVEGVTEVRHVGEELVGADTGVRVSL